MLHPSYNQLNYSKNVMRPLHEPVAKEKLGETSLIESGNVANNVKASYLSAAGIQISVLLDLAAWHGGRYLPI